METVIVLAMASAILAAAAGKEFTGPRGGKQQAGGESVPADD
jgi:hypothetical protein